MLNNNLILSALKHVTTSCLENLFDKEDLKIEDILDEDEILTTLKSNPEKFGKLIRTRADLIKDLFDYCIKESIDEKKQGYKFPFIASEIFALNNKDLSSCFFEVFNRSNQEIVKEKILRKIFLFLKEENSKEEIRGVKLLDYSMDFLRNNKFNPTIAGYIQKVLDSLLTVRGMDFLEYIFSNGRINDLMKQYEHLSIANFILRILKIDIPTLEINLFLFVKERIDILENFMNVYHKNSDSPSKENICQIFIDVLENHDKFNAGYKIIDFFSHKKILSIFFEDLQSKDQDEQYYSAQIILNIIRIFSAKAQLNKCLNDESPLRIKGELTDYQRVLNILYNNLSRLIKIITNENLTKEILLTCGPLVPFGKMRLILMEIILVCFQTVKDQRVIKKLLDEKILSILMKLFEVYKYNTFLHQTIQKIFQIFLEDEFYLKYINELFKEESSVIQFIIEKFNQNTLKG